MQPLRISDVRRPFSAESTARRLLRTLQLEPGAKVLEVFGGADGLAARLTKELGAEVVVAESDDNALEAARSAMRASGNVSKAESRKLDKPLPEADFQAVIVHTTHELPPRRIAEKFGRLVAHQGRLCGV